MMPKALRIFAWIVGGSFLLVVLGATKCDAQSTPFGKILYAPDRWWNSARAHNPWMYRLDDTEEKSAALSGTTCEVSGYGLSKVTPMSFRRGRQACAAIYVLRAVYGLASGETHRYGAHAKHVAAVTAVATLQVRIRFRW